MIKLLITGNIGKDAEVKTMDSGDKVLSFSVCHTDKYTKDGNTVETTTWVNCSKWFKKDASTKIADYLKKGQKVLVEGLPSARGYSQNNESKASLECRVIIIELLGSATQNTQNATTTQEEENPLPF
jgi:single-strand DNA-binding protein